MASRRSRAESNIPEEPTEAPAEEPTEAEAGPEGAQDGRTRDVDPAVKYDADQVDSLAELRVRAAAQRRILASEVQGGEDAPAEHVHDFDKVKGSVTRPTTVAEAEAAGPVERLGSDVYQLLVCSCGARVVGDRISG